MVMVGQVMWLVSQLNLKVQASVRTRSPTRRGGASTHPTVDEMHCTHGDDLDGPVMTLFLSG